jgi:hypothetical protein
MPLNLKIADIDAAGEMRAALLVRDPLLDAWSGPRMVARRAAPLEAGELLAVPDLLHRDAVYALALRTWRRYVVREIVSVRGVHRRQHRRNAPPLTSTTGRS